MSEVSASVRTLGGVPWDSWSFLQRPGMHGTVCLVLVG